MEKKGPVGRLKEKIEHQASELRDLKDKYLRALADLDNYRKRMERELDSYRQYAQVEFFNTIIPVLDSFERALNGINIESDCDQYAKGMGMIYRQLKDSLRSLGLEDFSSLGENFDPARHEAVAAVVNDEKPDNTVIEEICRGYIVRDRVIRPAKVLVSKQSEGGNENAKDNRY
jgi:molecular chaperone GrpE